MNSITTVRSPLFPKPTSAFFTERMLKVTMRTRTRFIARSALKKWWWEKKKEESLDFRLDIYTPNLAATIQELWASEGKSVEKF